MDVFLACIAPIPSSRPPLWLEDEDRYYAEHTLPLEGLFHRLLALTSLLREHAPALPLSAHRPHAI